MSAGGLPPIRADQLSRLTERTVQPGQRVLQVANNKTGLPLTVQISIPDATQANAVAGDGGTATLVAAGANTHGLLLWSAVLTSVVANTVAPGAITTGEDLIRGTGGTTYLSLVNSSAGVGAALASVNQDLWGFPVAAGFGIDLVAASIAAGHTVAANLVYSLLTA